jgi:hypothetical protein
VPLCHIAVMMKQTMASPKPQQNNYPCVPKWLPETVNRREEGQKKNKKIIACSNSQGDSYTKEVGLRWYGRFTKTWNQALKARNPVRKWVSASTKTATGKTLVEGQQGVALNDGQGAMLKGSGKNSTVFAGRAVPKQEIWPLRPSLKSSVSLSDLCLYRRST